MVKHVPEIGTLAVLLTFVLAVDGNGQSLRVGVVQSVISDSLEANRDRMIRIIGNASEAGCQLVVFSENELYWAGVKDRPPTKRAMDDAVQQIRGAARDAGLAVIFGADSRRVEGGEFLGRAYVFGPEGEQLAAYWKNLEVPRPFEVAGVRCNVTICSDRGYLEHSDLACLVAGSQIIIDTSGGHGGDDGRETLRWIRYRPWARRTGAWVIVSNPLHEDTDFMGNSPWGGGCAVIRPDGSIAASLVHQKHEMMVVDLDVAQATRAPAESRRHHPLFQEFWDLGAQLLRGHRIESMPKIEPYRSAARDVTIAAAQIACRGGLEENTQRVLRAIREASATRADIVVFPELALTGSRTEQVLAADQEALEVALRRVRDAAARDQIHVVVGLPWFVDGQRRNCAFVIGADGAILTRYDQISAGRSTGAPNRLFQPGESLKPMWFTLNGVHAIVTIGDDADWVEIGDLAAARGMCLRFHISNVDDPTEDHALLRKQRDLLALSYAQLGAVVNAHGGSLIASREGGHNLPPPAGLEHYLPYQTSVVVSAGREETTLYATRRTKAFNSQDLDRYWRNRIRKSRAETGWYDWINAGATMISPAAAQ